MLTGSPAAAVMPESTICRKGTSRVKMVYRLEVRGMPVTSVAKGRA